MSEGAALGLTPAAAFDFLLGEWRLEREIRGHAAIEGLLTVSARADGAAEYREKVAVTTREGAVFSGSQRYLVTRAKNGFVLSFAETGAVFQEIYLAATAEGGLRGEAIHRCGEDVYRSEYALGPGRRFTVRHAVTGPRKQYVSDTAFSAVG